MFFAIMRLSKPQKPDLDTYANLFL